MIISGSISIPKVKINYTHRNCFGAVQRVNAMNFHFERDKKNSSHALPFILNVHTQCTAFACSPPDSVWSAKLLCKYTLCKTSREK